MYSFTQTKRRNMLMSYFNKSMLVNSDIYSVYGHSLLIFSLRQMKLHVKIHQHGASFVKYLFNKNVSEYF